MYILDKVESGASINVQDIETTRRLTPHNPLFQLQKILFSNKGVPELTNVQFLGIQDDTHSLLRQ